MVEQVLHQAHELHRLLTMEFEALKSQDRQNLIPPLHGALLKNEQDVHLFERIMMMARNHR